MNNDGNNEKNRNSDNVKHPLVAIAGIVFVLLFAAFVWAHKHPHTQSVANILIQPDISGSMTTSGGQHGPMLETTNGAETSPEVEVPIKPEDDEQYDPAQIDDTGSQALADSVNDPDDANYKVDAVFIWFCAGATEICDKQIPVMRRLNAHFNGRVSFTRVDVYDNTASAILAFYAVHDSPTYVVRARGVAHYVKITEPQTEEQLSAAIQRQLSRVKPRAKHKEDSDQTDEPKSDQ